MLRSLDRGLERLYTLAGYLAAIFLISLACFVLASIISRLASTYVPGLSEYSGYSMAAASFFALAYTFRSNGHIRVNILLIRLHGAVRRAMELWCLLVASFFTSYLAYFSIKMTMVSWQFEEKSEGSDAMLLWFPQLGMAIGATILAIAVLHSLIKLVAGADVADQDHVTPSGEG